jgi:hypothetical protein
MIIVRGLRANPRIHVFSLTTFKLGDPFSPVYGDGVSHAYSVTIAPLHPVVTAAEALVPNASIIT